MQERYREARGTDSASTTARPGRRLTRLTFELRRNIDVRYRSPLHFLELWSITGALSCWVRVHDYRLPAAADRHNLLACIFQENILPAVPFPRFSSIPCFLYMLDSHSGNTVIVADGKDRMLVSIGTLIPGDLTFALRRTCLRCNLKYLLWR